MSSAPSRLWCSAWPLRRGLPAGRPDGGHGGLAHRSPAGPVGFARVPAVRQYLRHPPPQIVRARRGSLRMAAVARTVSTAAMAMSLALAAGAAARAQDLAAKAALCDACHGEQGIPADPMMPVIWGQHQAYLFRQIGEFKDRKSVV